MLSDASLEANPVLVSPTNPLSLDRDWCSHIHVRYVPGHLDVFLSFTVLGVVEWRYIITLVPATLSKSFCD